MVKVKTDEIKEKIAKQEEEVYGENLIGHTEGEELNDDINESYKKEFGNAPQGEVDIEKEMNSDEKERRGWEKSDNVIVQTQQEPDKRIERIGEVSVKDHLEEDKSYSE